MSKETLRMQMLSGVITESEYKAKLEEIEENKKLTTKAVREYWGEASNTDNPVSHPYGVTYEIYEYEGDTLGKLVDTAPYVDLFTTKDQAEDYINEFNSNSLEERNLKDQQFNWDMLYDENKEYRHNENKKSLNENFVGMGMVGNIFDREKTDYELAFEHFTKGTSLKEEMGDEIGKEELIEKIKNLGDFGFTGESIEFNSLLITCSTQEDNEETPRYFVYEEGDESEDGIFNSTNPNEVAEFVSNY